MTEPLTEGPLSFELPHEVPTRSEVIARVRQEAERLGENPRAILREVELNTPTGRFILKLLGLPAQGVPVGRKTDTDRQHAIVSAVERLVHEGRTLAEAHRLAPTILAREGICGPGRGRPKLTPTGVRMIRREWLQRWWRSPTEG